MKTKQTPKIQILGEYFHATNFINICNIYLLEYEKAIKKNTLKISTEMQITQELLNLFKELSIYVEHKNDIIEKKLKPEVLYTEALISDKKEHKRVESCHQLIKNNEIIEKRLLNIDEALADGFREFYLAVTRHALIFDYGISKKTRRDNPELYIYKRGKYPLKLKHFEGKWTREISRGLRRMSVGQIKKEKSEINPKWKISTALGLRLRELVGFGRIARDIKREYKKGARKFVLSCGAGHINKYATLFRKFNFRVKEVHNIGEGELLHAECVKSERKLRKMFKLSDEYVENPKVQWKAYLELLKD